MSDDARVLLLERIAELQIEREELQRAKRFGHALIAQHRSEGVRMALDLLLDKGLIDHHRGDRNGSLTHIAERRD